MTAETGVRILVSLSLMLGNAFFVAAEYGLVGCRRNRIEAMAKKGGRAAQSLLAALDRLSAYVAGIQVGITMIGIGIGSITEPLVTEAIRKTLGVRVGPAVSIALSLILVTFFFVIIGELIPKYVSLKFSERVALLLIRPLRFVITVLTPLVWLVERAGFLVLKPFRIDPRAMEGDDVSKEELLLMVRSGGNDGVLENAHAQVISKALRFDELDASDIMIHRLDVKWIPLDTPREKLLDAVAHSSHNRIPVCRDDVDDMVGILYLQDLVRTYETPDFSLEALLRPVEVIPENLSLNKIISRMREAKTQILIVVDEYGGTSGLVTLEDVAEEVFGDLEDQLESERPPIEITAHRRVSARASVRLDELLEFLKIETEHDEEKVTDTLANIVVNRLGRVPRLGDAVEIGLGSLRVENMARRRVTRVSLYLNRDLDESS